MSPRPPACDYVELRCRSAFSFLEASANPEDLVFAAAEQGHTALALADRDGLYGIPRFHAAARAAGVRAIVGAEVHVDESGSPAAALTLLVETPRGYRNLSRLITCGHARAAKGHALVSWDEVEEHAADLCALVRGDDRLTPALLDRARAIFPGRLWLDLSRHGRREQERSNRRAFDLADAHGVPVVATGDVRHARPDERMLTDALVCLRAKTRLDRAGRLLAGNAEQHLHTREEMVARFADRPAWIRATRAIAERCAFSLENLGYRFPEFPIPPGETQASFLRILTEYGARDRYGTPVPARVRRQLDHELALIEKLDLAGYFLIVHDIVRFACEVPMLVQGRGSAANSAVCYALGITAVDPVAMELLFERFLSEERGEWPDIDLDLPSGDRRERVIQHLYERYGASGAAITANVITYRDRSASREIGKVLEIPPEEIDHLARYMRRFEYVDTDDTLEKRLSRAGIDAGDRRIRLFARLFEEIQDLPRHLGQHSGGMVIAQGRLDRVVPLEPATMPGRVVIQWDKDDCADLGIIKVDLLGLGMMSALQDCLALLKDTGVEVDLAHLPADDPKVYAMLQKADTVGLFQVESRAQMATLPRMKPDHFYDLVVAVAIIRPGPIVGKMVHPYLNRRSGREPVVYAHPALEPILKRTLGVPLFQEQLLRMAMTVAGFTGGEAEELRRAMGFKRSMKRMEAIEERLRAGMRERGITGETADEVVRSITSFALYGFPESHAASFALLAYASAWLKCHHPAAFVCALLNNQPMGFYHPFTLVKDAQRHGVRFHPVDVTRSDALCTLEQDEVRLGLSYVRGLRTESAQRIEKERKRAPFASLQDFVDHAGLRRDEQRMLAEVGALNAFGLTRRSALWQVEKAGRPRGPLFRVAEDPELAASPLPDMTLAERLGSDLLGTSLTVGPHPMALFRERLRARGVRRAVDLMNLPDGSYVRVAGAVICRQRPGTAKGFLFLTLEDETGLVNVIVRPDLFERDHAALVSPQVLEIDGVLQTNDGTSVRALRARPAPVGDFPIESRDFH